MSEKMTAVSLDGVRNDHMIAEWGDVDPLEIIATIKSIHAERKAVAEKVLAAAPEDFVVETYRGPVAMNGRKKIWPVQA